jgi:glyoxylase-like metal-dependent hydrolase (beta-lactamase superfamily II)
MSDIPHGTGFVEVGDRCWVARFDFLDVSAGLVGGDRGLLVVDTLASDAAGRRLVEEVRRLGVGDVVGIVNTHVHFDHVFGNRAVLEAYGGPPVVAHEATAEELDAHAAAAREEAARSDDPGYAEVAATTDVLGPTDTFSSARVVDLGDRVVEVLHPGRGHTAGDAVVRVGDADVLFAGDLVEESALRNGVPGFGEDCFPMEWPASLDLVVGMLGEGTVVVPGHGNPVDRDFVQEQRSAIGVVAETIRDLASRGVPVSEALDATEWPYPREELRHAVSRGYQQLPRGTRSLPLL